jgi:DNA ligase-1
MRKPMLADNADVSKLKFPFYASTKLDGVRGIVEDGILYSRSGKPIRNEFIQNYFLARPELEGLDGELIVGDPYASDVYLKTNSAVMTIKGEPDFRFYVFDHRLDPDLPYKARLKALHGIKDNRLVHVHQKLISDLAELDKYENEMLQMGFEGLILRGIDAPYKFGRSTVKEGYLLKLKRFNDAEAQIIECHEMMHNDNEAQEDAFGHTERSSAKAGMVPAGILGALTVKNLNTGQVFSVGSGFTLAQRQEYWKKRKQLIGKFLKYKYFDVGVKDLPRFPTFIGFRDPDDM